ncbi:MULTISPECIES: c-type cytochrome [unclassified Arenibacter]|uniref:c-type cytochrome n=1 Tax=unclassified Arenibacter TaxID=2615047 RepID=UPI0015F2A3F7|nr:MULTISPECIES: c-type cytochrome [unclassified Arenibacter]
MKLERNMGYRNFWGTLCLLTGMLLILFSCGSEAEGPIKERIVMDNITLPKGFDIKKIYSPEEHHQGSWVSITKDDHGRLYTSDQFGYLYQVTLPSGANKQDSVVVKKLDIGIGLAQGLLWHKEVLYALVNSNVNRDLHIHSGFYKITDSDGNGEFDKVDTLRVFKGSFGEHGPHSIELSPDKKSLYLVLGNRIVIPEGLDSYVPKVWGEDNILPVITDPSGHANEVMAPGGWVAKIDLKSEEWTVHNVGMRNTYDIAFNQDGELFGFDSDMELDLGMPWYRPIRLCHFTSGSEFGWRKGTGKFPAEYPDNLPGIANLGQGSPTGLMNGEGLRFPPYYQNGLYLFDWSYGTMYFASLTPKGSSYSVEIKEFLSGVPLPLTNGVVGNDGSMYFLTGGRKLESALYKLTYTGEAATKIRDLPENTEGATERDLRKELEVLHLQRAADKMDFILENLDHPDRFTRFAARIAMENQEYELWKDEITNKTPPLKTIALAISIARHGVDVDRLRALDTLLNIQWTTLPESQQVDFIRAIELLLIRTGEEIPESVKKRLINVLISAYPLSGDIVNKELCKTLSFLQVPAIIEPTLEMMERDTLITAEQKANYLSGDISGRNEQYGSEVEEMLQNMPNAQHISYAKSLSVLQRGWTSELRKRYFNWYNRALKKSGGKSYAQYIRKIQEKALDYVPMAERQYFEALATEAILESNNLMQGVEQPKGPGQNWTVATVKSAYAKNKDKVNYENGQNFYKASLCVGCHSVKGVGGNSGPELTQLGTRFTISDMAEAIIDPSGTISDRYRFTEYHLPEGRVVTGKLVKETKSELIIGTNAFSPDLTTIIKKKDILKEEESPISPMPPGLINRLNEKELSDLLAFLISGGDKNHKIYNE